jgi:hypothetical protein
MDTIKLNEWYYTTDQSLYCCDEFQYVNYCYAHDEAQGCYYCESDYFKKCECD